jgi:hypothetical protein
MTNFMRKCLEIRKSWKVDRSIFPITDCYRSAPERPIRSFSMTKNNSPSDFRSRIRWFRDLGCLYQERNPREGRRVILHGFLTLISFYKAISMPPCWGAIIRAVARFNFVHFVIYFSSYFL